MKVAVYLRVVTLADALYLYDTVTRPPQAPQTRVARPLAAGERKSRFR